MIQVTLTFDDEFAVAEFFAQRLGKTRQVSLVQTLGGTFVTANEKAAVLQANETAMANTVDPTPAPKAEAPGNAPPAPSSAAPTAPSPRTAAAAPSPSAPSPAAPAPAPTATQPPAPAPAAEGEFKYETLQKAVNAAVPKHGKEALLAIAKRHGADNFKGLPASAWAAAHADVVALG